MTRKLTCAAGRCNGAPAITKPLPLCPLHGLEVASQIAADVFRSALATAHRNAPHLTAPPPVRRTQAEAYLLADEYLTGMEDQGVVWFAYADVKGVVPLTGKSRSWVYAWLDKRADEGRLVREDRHGRTGWRFAA